MPFTPFHMGLGLALKPTLGKHFSLVTFGVAQIAIDIEPLIAMILNWPVLHGPSHTLLGALLIGLVVAWFAPLLGNRLLKRYNQEVAHYRLAWLQENTLISRYAAFTGALCGTFSHILLDSLMHHDMQPLAGFSKANPLIDLIAHDSVYWLCTVIGIIGLIAWLVGKWLGQNRHR